MTAQDIEAKLKYLRQDTADALRVYLNLRGDGRVVPHSQAGEHINIAALGYINAHTKYTLACLEAKRGDILPYVELPTDG